MTFDRDEQFLHEKLSAGLHPAPVDLWPAVAENLPAKPHRRHLWLCLAAPLLIAAGVAATGAQFTDLRTNPRPSFAPDATAGYAISYERQYYTLPADLWAGMQANHNLEAAADGTLPAGGIMHGRIYPNNHDKQNIYSKAARGYETWSAMAEATGLPLAENSVLDAGEPEPAVQLFIRITADNGYWEESSLAQVGFIPVGNEAPEKLYLKRMDYLDDPEGRRYEIELMALAYLGDAPADTTAINYFNKRAGLTWDCETYEMPNGCTALLPLCTSNPNSYTYYSTWAFFEKDGILYQLGCTPVAGYSSSTTEEDHAMLKQVLDGFAA